MVEKQKRKGNIISNYFDAQSCHIIYPVMDCHAIARGSIPGRNSVFIKLHILCKGQ